MIGSCDYIAWPPLPGYVYACNSGMLCVYLSKLKSSGAYAPLGPTVDTPLATCV